MSSTFFKILEIIFQNPELHHSRRGDPCGRPLLRHAWRGGLPQGQPLRVILQVVGSGDGLEHHEALAAQGQLVIPDDTDAQGVDALVLAVQHQLLGVHAGIHGHQQLAPLVQPRRPACPIYGIE